MRLNAADELPRQRDIASGMTTFDERLALPVMGHRRVVLLSAREANCQFSFVALRTQAQIDAEYRSFPRGPRQYFANKLCQADKIFPIGNLRVSRFFAI